MAHGWVESGQTDVAGSFSFVNHDWDLRPRNWNLRPHLRIRKDTLSVGLWRLFQFWFEPPIFRFGSRHLFRWDNDFFDHRLQFCLSWQSHWTVSIFFIANWSFFSKVALDVVRLGSSTKKLKFTTTEGSADLPIWEHSHWINWSVKWPSMLSVVSLLLPSFVLWVMMVSWLFSSV